MTIGSKTITGQADELQFARSEARFFAQLAQCRGLGCLVGGDPATGQLPFVSACVAFAFTEQYPLPMRQDQCYTAGHAVYACVDLNLPARRSKDELYVILRVYAGAI